MKLRSWWARGSDRKRPACQNLIRQGKWKATTVETLSSRQLMSTFAENTMIPPAAFPANWSLADLQAHLGGVPAGRIRLFPAPGTATEEDALWLEDHEDRLCELVDGVLVEKAM